MKKDSDRGGAQRHYQSGTALISTRRDKSSGWRIEYVVVEVVGNPSGPGSGGAKGEY